MIDKLDLMRGLEAERQLLAAECPDDMAGSYRNQDETLALGMASSDESRIKMLGALAREGRIDPHNAMFFFDTAIYFTDPVQAKVAQQVAQYEQLPTNPLGRVERFVRRVVHPGLRHYVKHG